MKKRLEIGLVLLGIVIAFFAWRWRQDEPRRLCLVSLQQLAASLHSGNSSALLDLIVQPAALRGRTPAEQTEFLTKALREEISAEGLAVLKRDGQFGSLTNVFPAEAETWTKQAGAKPEDCVAFKLERNGLRAEVVLTTDGRPATSGKRSSYRIVRCNNVKQMTWTSPSDPSSNRNGAASND